MTPPPLATIQLLKSSNRVAIAPLLAGLMVAPIKNSQTITIEVSTAHGYLQLFDQNGVGSKVYEPLTVRPGEMVERSLRIKGRF